MQIKENQVVSIKYDLYEFGKNDILDSNMNQKPLEFITGSGQVIPGLEKELLKLSKGDKADIKVEPTEAYGLYNDEAVEVIPREQFSGLELEKGMTLYGQSEDGRSVQVIVKDFNDENVTVDFNHPLAGKTLLFSVEITDARDATQEEINSGVVGGDSCGCGTGGCSTH